MPVLEFDPIDVLRDVAAIQRRTVEPPADLADELERDRGRGADRGGRLPRRRRIALIALVGVVLGGGAVAAGWWLTQPSSPEGGSVCRTASTANANQYAIEVGEDPLARCAELWRTGLLPDPEAPLPAGRAVPPLTACIGRGGVVEVYPSPAGICAELGLQPADPDPTPEVDAIVELQARILEINAIPCESAEEIQSKIEQLLDELGLIGWDLTIQPSPPEPACAKAGVDSNTTTITIGFIPAPP